MDELHFQRSVDKRFVEWRQRLTCAKPMKDEVIPPTREGDVSTRHVHCRRKVPTIKKFAVKFRIEVEFSELFEQIRHLNYNQLESRNSHPVPGLLINSAGKEVVA